MGGLNVSGSGLTVAGSSTQAGPVSQVQVVDNFEAALYEDVGNTLSDYYSLDVGNFTRQQTEVKVGSYALNTGDWRNIESNSGLPYYPVEGDTASIWMKADSGTEANAFFMAAGNGANVGVPNDGYGVQWKPRNGSATITERAGGSSVNTSSWNVSTPGNTWRRFEWKYDAGTLSGSIYDENDNHLDTTSLTTNNDFSANSAIFLGKVLNDGDAFFDQYVVL